MLLKNNTTEINEVSKMSSVGRSDVSRNLNQQFNHHSAQPHNNQLERSQAFLNTAELNTSSITGANLSSNENLDCPNNSTRFFANSSSNIENFQLQKEVDQLRAVLSQTSVKATQIVLGNPWRDFQFNNLDENLMSSMCQNVLKNSNRSILEKAFQDEALFESPVCDFLCQKKQIITRVLKSVTCDQLSSFVPESTLNKTLAERVKYVPARDLINWLASADRLGYKPDDILDDDEIVIPNKTSQDLYETRQDKKSVDKNPVVNSQAKLLLEPVKDTRSDTMQANQSNTIQRAQNFNSTELQGQVITKSRRLDQAEQHRSASTVSLRDTPNVAIPHSSYIPDSSNTWLSGRNAHCPMFQSSELVRELDGTSNKNSNINPQYIIPSSYSPQTIGNNLSSSRRPSALNISQPSPQLDQPTIIKPLNAPSNMPQRSASLSSPTVLNSPPLHPSSKAITLLQSEIRAVDEMLKKEVASIPTGISQDQRLAKISTLVNLASVQKHKLGISHGIYVDMQQISNMTRESLRSDPSMQETRPAIMYGSSNNYPQANSSNTGSNRPSPVLENGSSLVNCAFTDRNPFTHQLGTNTRNFPPVYITPYANSESNQTFKRPRSESNMINPRPVGPNQSFNNGSTNLNINTGVDPKSYSMNPQYQSSQVESQPVTSGPIIQNTDPVNLLASHSPVSISATSEFSGSKES